MILSVNKETMTAEVELYRGGGDTDNLHELSWWSMNPDYARMYGEVESRVITLPIKEIVEWFEDELYVFDVNHPYVFGESGDLRSEVSMELSDIFGMNVRDDYTFRIGKLDNVHFCIGLNYIGGIDNE